MAQEPYLISREYGRSLEETIALIKRHEAFEKSAAAQEERFLALEKLTTVSQSFCRAALHFLDFCYGEGGGGGGCIASVVKCDKIR